MGACLIHLSSSAAFDPWRFLGWAGGWEGCNFAFLAHLKSNAGEMF